MGYGPYVTDINIFPFTRQRHQSELQRVATHCAQSQISSFDFCQIGHFWRSFFYKPHPLLMAKQTCQSADD